MEYLVDKLIDWLNAQEAEGMTGVSCKSTPSPPEEEEEEEETTAGSEALDPSQLNLLIQLKPQPYINTADRL